MPQEKPNHKTVHVSEETHSQVKEFLEEQNEGKDIGKFFDKAGIEKLQREKQIIEKSKNKKL